MQRAAEVEWRRIEVEKDEKLSTHRTLTTRSRLSSRTRHTQSQPLMRRQKRPASSPTYTKQGSRTQAHPSRPEKQRSPRKVVTKQTVPQPSLDFKLYKGHGLVFSQSQQRIQKKGIEEKDILEGYSREEIKKLIQKRGGRIPLKVRGASSQTTSRSSLKPYRGGTPITTWKMANKQQPEIVSHTDIIRQKKPVRRGSAKPRRPMSKKQPSAQVRRQRPMTSVPRSRTACS